MRRLGPELSYPPGLQRERRLACNHFRTKFVAGVPSLSAMADKGKRRLSIFQNDFHALVFVGFQHPDRLLEIQERDDVSHERLEFERSTRH